MREKGAGKTDGQRRADETDAGVKMGLWLRQRLGRRRVDDDCFDSKWRWMMGMEFWH